jgi:hypothetical protein
MHDLECRLNRSRKSAFVCYTTSAQDVKYGQIIHSCCIYSSNTLQNLFKWPRNLLTKIQQQELRVVERRQKAHCTSQDPLFRCLTDKSNRTKDPEVSLYEMADKGKSNAKPVPYLGSPVWRSLGKKKETILRGPRAKKVTISKLDLVYVNVLEGFGKTSTNVKSLALVKEIREYDDEDDLLWVFLVCVEGGEVVGYCAAGGS